MGATLGHMVVLYFNTTRKEVIGMTTSIDYNSTDAHTKANSNANIKFVLGNTEWAQTDQVICALSILEVKEPYGGVVKMDSDDIIFDTNFSVTFNVVSNDLNNGCQIDRFFVTDIATKNVTTYEVTEFNNVCPEEDSDSCANCADCDDDCDDFCVNCDDNCVNSNDECDECDDCTNCTKDPVETTDP